MELMNWIIKPFDKFMIWLGSTVFNTTVFGIKLGYIVIYVGTIYMVFTLVDAVYDKGFDAGVESITK
jgi:hypothetical protein|tara:strand:+ start:85 stop:285 length:201 start_codon:yes stop_codon:yes gene_type:complete